LRGIDALRYCPRLTVDVGDNAFARAYCQQNLIPCA